MRKPMVWAERLGYQITVREAHCRTAAAMHTGETPHDTMRRMGFKVVGGFTVDNNVPGRATALVVRI